MQISSLRSILGLLYSNSHNSPEETKAELVMISLHIPSRPLWKTFRTSSVIKRPYANYHLRVNLHIFPNFVDISQYLIPILGQ